MVQIHHQPEPSVPGYTQKSDIESLETINVFEASTLIYQYMLPSLVSNRDNNLTNINFNVDFSDFEYLYIYETIIIVS